LLLDYIWEEYKFRNWDLTLYRDGNTINKNILYYTPPSYRNFKLEKAGIIRYSYYEYYTNIISTTDVNTLREKLKMYSTMIMDNIFSLDMHVFNIGLQIVERKVHNIINDIYPKIGELIYEKKIDKDEQISLDDIFSGIRYLMSLSYLYSYSTHRNFNESNFNVLCPVVPINNLVEDFSSKYNLNKQISRIILDYFILNPHTQTKEKDIFSKPLIYVGSSNIVFTPYLIDQMNINRVIENILSISKIDESIKGVNLEKYLIKQLESSKHLKVNNEKVRFDAYDGKEVEYDLIAVLDHTIILMEIKCLNTPYSTYEFYLREKEILKGVEQVNRREDILVKQPEEIIKRINIDFPTEQPTKKDIIKIVCTDIYQFTGRIESDVHVIDSSAFLKFFLDPKIEGIRVNKDENELMDFYYIWRDKPDVNILKSYLSMPAAIRKIVYNLEEKNREITSLGKDSGKSAFLDFVLKKDPYGVNGTTINLGRNDMCFCGSNKKFKKCCGR
jgi:hypothetical protein